MFNPRYIEIIKKLNCFFKKKNSLVFIHADIFRSFKVDFTNKYDFFKKHLTFIKKITNSSKLIFPAFNYKFPKTNEFNIQKDKAETDHFTEYYRKNFSKFRTTVPIFSSTSDFKINGFYKLSKTINPFGKKSIFHYLYNRNGKILYYGAPFSASTFIMYVEETFRNGPIYRYEKKIHGKIINKKKTLHVNFTFHVRPPSDKYHLEYDWKKIENDLKKNKLIYIYKNGIMQFRVLNVKKVTNYLHSRLKKDDFYLIDKKSKKWIIPFFKKINRRFIINDFE